MAAPGPSSATRRPAPSMSRSPARRTTCSGSRRATGPGTSARGRRRLSSAVQITPKRARRSHTPGRGPLQTATSYLGGKAKVSGTRAASATFKFTGNQVAWLSRRSDISGSARVYVDGVLVTTVDLYSSTTSVKQVVFTRKFSTIGAHTLKIAVLGTAGHPRVTVDSFFVPSLAALALARRTSGVRREGTELESRARTSGLRQALPAPLP